MVFGTEQEKATLVAKGDELAERVGIVRIHLQMQPERLVTTDQPATDRWRGLISSVLPALVEAENWPTFAADLDQGAAAGIDVARELPRLALSEPSERPDVSPDPAAPRPASPAQPGTPTPTPPPPEQMVTAAGCYRPLSNGPRI